MPPFQSRSTGARRMARISSAGRQGLGLDAEGGPHLGRQRDRLGRAGEDAAAGRDQRPGRSRPTTSGAGRRGVPVRRRLAAGSGSGSRKMWRWSKAATSRSEREQSSPLPNTSPDMSPMPTTVMGAVVGVDAEVAEVALDRLPGALGGDAHLLVVVARRAAGGEGVAEPEAVLGGDGVGQVGEGGRALVGRHHQVGVVAVVGDDRRRVDDLAADDVVGHVEQAGHEVAVAGGHLGRSTAVPVPGRPAAAS